MKIKQICYTPKFVASNVYLGDSSPVSSSPSTPTRRTVSSIPAVWYLRANAFSSGKNPICTLKKYQSLSKLRDVQNLQDKKG
jgi:hypothetical protein